jgi:hypothetical protein
MRFLKDFHKFVESLDVAEPVVSTGGTKTKPDVRPGVRPNVKPSSPSPIRRDKPSVNPKPKALIDDKQKLSTFEDIANRFINLMNKKGEDIKKFIDK